MSPDNGAKRRDDQCSVFQFGDLVLIKGWREEDYFAMISKTRYPEELADGWFYVRRVLDLDRVNTARVDQIQLVTRAV